jgi:hypothetical protein
LQTTYLGYYSVFCPAVAVKISWIDALKATKVGRHAHHTKGYIGMDAIYLNNIPSGRSTCSKSSPVNPQLSLSAFKHSNLSSRREIPTVLPVVTPMVQYTTAPQDWLYRGSQHFGVNPDGLKRYAAFRGGTFSLNRSFGHPPACYQLNQLGLCFKILVDTKPGETDV